MCIFPSWSGLVRRYSSRTPYLFSLHGMFRIVLWEECTCTRHLIYDLHVIANLVHR